MTRTTSAVAECARARALPGSPIRVLLALSGLHRVSRGAEVAFEDLARWMARREGFAVTLMGSGEERANEPYTYRRVGCVCRENFLRWPKLPYFRNHYAYEEITFAARLATAYSPTDFDVTITCGYPYTNWMLRWKRDRQRRPLHVFVTQNGDWMVRTRNREYRHFACDGLVTTNPEFHERHQGRWPCALIPNGVDTRAFAPGDSARNAMGLPEGSAVALIVSALTREKRVLEGIECAARVPGLFLVVAGKGELEREVEEAGRRLMPGRFRLLSLARPQMPDLYRSADVLLHMSPDEPFGNVYIEAMATGMPVVAHDWPGTRWILQDKGILVDCGREEAVVDGLHQALSRRGGAWAAERRATTVRRFSWEIVSEQYCQFLLALYGGSATT